MHCIILIILDAIIILVIITANADITLVDNFSPQERIGTSYGKVSTTQLLLTMQRLCSSRCLVFIIIVGVIIILIIITKLYYIQHPISHC